MKKILLLITLLLTSNLSAQDYLYRAINNINVTMSTTENTEPSEETQEQADANCYTAPVGSIGEWDGCDGKLIVSNNTLRDLIKSGGDYSDSVIFTGQVTDMSYLFCNFDDTVTGYSTCTQEDPTIYSISNWDVSNVTNMQYMFFYADNFNQNINSWNVSNVTTMKNMFRESSSFNQPLDAWNTSSLTNAAYMFFKATSFNQSLNTWNTGNIIKIQSMFFNAINFNQPLNNWNVSNVDYMLSMFSSASSFNQDISSWCLPLISEKPTNFDLNSGFEGMDNMQPNWGGCP